MHLVLGLVLLAQVQTLVPLERPEAAAERIRQLCPVASPRDHQRLVKLEHGLADSTSGKHASPDLWGALGCARALLAVNASLDRDGELLKPLEASRVEDAIGVLIKALDRRPGDVHATELLAVLSQQATAVPADAKAMLLDDLATIMHNAVRAGITAPAVFRACTRLQIAVGDIATARDCTSRAMKFGSDSTWHLLRLARVAFSNGDDLIGTIRFKQAALSAHDSSAMNELLYPFFTEANWALWLAVPDADRAGWLRDSLFPNKIYQLKTYASRLGLQLAESRSGGGRSYYWWCMPHLPSTCMQLGSKGETVIRTAARFNQLWNIETGAPVALITYGARIGDLASEKHHAERVAKVEITIHGWDQVAGRWSDTTLQQQLRYPASTLPDAFATGRVTIPASPSVSSWAIRISQSPARRGRAADDQHAPLSSGPMRLSDLMVGTVSPDSAGKDARTGMVLAPLGHVRRTQPVQLFFQVWSELDHPRLKLVITLRDTEAVDDVPVVQIALLGATKQGFNEFSRAFSVSHLFPGSYRLQVLIMDEVTGATVKRETTLLVD